jgi:pyroglutamyl-peptidase
MFRRIFVTTALILAMSAAGAAEPSDAPVILLTGFQPFGPGRPANPSWEGIKDLDGREWRGYRLACREMPVDWGAPMVHLSKWIDALKPVAVFSFGQGGADAFAIETRARNERGGGADNRGQLAKNPLIAGDGPEEFAATIDSKALAAELKRAGYPTRISTNAGQYLCEEALYTLEYLRAKRDFAGSVMFCHVPPLGAALDGTSVDAAYVQKFVEALLGAWADAQEQPATVQSSTKAIQRQAAADPREEGVRELIERYFRTWSAQDIDRYGQCFMPQAAIQLIDAGGRLTTMPLRQFLETQRASHRDAEHPLTETPETIEIKFEGVLARVIVYWKLVSGEREEYGYDHFTLMPAGGGWRIANLIFYATDAGDETK